jgi:hypothetical protein
MPFKNCSMKYSMVGVSAEKLNDHRHHPRRRMIQ